MAYLISRFNLNISSFFLIFPKNAIFVCMNMEDPTKQNIPPEQPDEQKKKKTYEQKELYGE